MNDLTKEELEDITQCIDYAYRSNPISPRISLTLRNKLQSMIDNYCEHEWAYYFSPQGSDVKCQKCGRKLYDN